MITKETINKHLWLIKEEAKIKISKLNFLRGIEYIELFAKLSYKYNLFYTDDEVENLIDKISTSILGKIEIVNKENKIIFYDSFAMDNRGLTQQYLRAIFSWNCELLYITNNKIGQDILNELNNYSKVKIICYERNNFNDLKKVVKEIFDFQPEKVLLHFSPWDISGFCIWNSIKNVNRFLINLTDHAFWLGKGCADYILEFRAYGSYLSVYHRNFPLNKLLLQPYYPIINNKKFEGFPFDKENKLIAFAGSNLYKIAGRENLFLNLIKEILQQNNDLIFVLAGPGDKTDIQDFIDTNKLNERFYLIGNRNDISAVVENIDIFVNTFPMIGGLMSQYAAVLHKPIIGYSSLDLYGYNDVEDLLQITQKGLLVKKNKAEFLSYFKQLIENSNTRTENIEFTSDSVLTPESFNLRLYQNIYNYAYNINTNIISNVCFNSQAIADLYIDMENSYEKKHFSIIVSSLKIRSLYHFPFSVTRYFLLKLKSKLKEI